jgi:hypothetical protein
LFAGTSGTYLLALGDGRRHRFDGAVTTHLLPARELGHVLAEVGVELLVESFETASLCFFLGPLLVDGEAAEVRGESGVNVLIEAFVSREPVATSSRRARVR